MHGLWRTREEEVLIDKYTGGGPWWTCLVAKVVLPGSDDVAEGFKEILSSAQSFIRLAGAGLNKYLQHPATQAQASEDLLG